MFKQTIQLSPDEILQLTWGKNYANFTITLNGQFVGFISDKSSLKLGGTFALPGEGNRKIMVILSEQGLNVWQDGVELLSGLRSGDSDHFSNAIRYLIAFSTVQLLFGLGYTWFSRNGNDPDLFLIWLIMSIDAVVLIGLALWARYGQITLPLVIALVLVGVGLLLNSGIPFGWLLSLLVGYYLYKGVRAGPLRQNVVSKFGTDTPLDAGI